MFNLQLNSQFLIYQNCDSNQQQDIQTKKDYLIRHIRFWRINIVLLVMVEVVLVLIQTTSPDRKITLAVTGMIIFSVNLRIFEQHPMWHII